MVIRDENERELEVITQWQGTKYISIYYFVQDSIYIFIFSESYYLLRKDMCCESILMSSSATYTSLELITDVYIPDCNVWCGDYPYLNKQPFISFMRTLESAGVISAAGGGGSKSKNQKSTNSVVSPSKSGSSSSSDSANISNRNSETLYGLRRRSS